VRAQVALAAIVVACGAAPKPVLSGHGAATPPTGPAPRIKFANGAFDDSEGLPAVARRGTVVVLELRDNDAGRGNPNLRLEVRDRRDKPSEKLAVMAANEFERLVPDGLQAAPPLEQRIAAVNRRLAELHEEYDLVPLQEYGNAELFGRTIEASDFIATFGSDSVFSMRTRDGKLLASVDGTPWLAPSQTRCAQCPPCENPIWLKSLYVGDKLVVVRVGYTGTDTCWEPSDQLHVVAW
jgi:hypothetical protein